MPGGDSTSVRVLMVKQEAFKLRVFETVISVCLLKVVQRGVVFSERQRLITYALKIYHVAYNDGNPRTFCRTNNSQEIINSVVCF